jgi:multicomponent Na+:H+ antiporter subunit F
MTSFYFGFSLFLLLSLAGGLVRIIRGPTRPDRLLAGQLLGTTGVAILLVLGQALDRPGLRDVALLFALLAAFNVVVFVRSGTDPVRPAGERKP